MTSSDIQVSFAICALVSRVARVGLLVQLTMVALQQLLANHGFSQDQLSILTLSLLITVDLWISSDSDHVKVHGNYSLFIKR